MILISILSITMILFLMLELSCVMCEQTNVQTNQPEILDDAFNILRDQTENVTVSFSNLPTYILLHYVFCNTPE